MDNKDKIIQEMAKVIGWDCDNKSMDYCDKVDDCDKCRAIDLYNAGYRKLDDHAIMVLRKAKGLEERIRKETAKEILNDLWNKEFETTITIQNSCSKEDIENVGKAILTSIRNELCELAKQYGVDLGVGV